MLFNLTYFGFTSGNPNKEVTFETLSGNLKARKEGTLCLLSNPYTGRNKLVRINIHSQRPGGGGWLLKKVLYEKALPHSPTPYP